MSHFSVLVIGPGAERQLAPYHEFECTGRDDEFVKDVNITEEARAQYAEDETTYYQDPEGKLHSRFTPEGEWDPTFFRDPFPEEVEKYGMDKRCIFDGSDEKDGVEWVKKDWNDGKGSRAKVKDLPEGWKQVEAKTSLMESLAEFTEGYYGSIIVPFGQQPDLIKTHKYGYIIVDENGDVVKVIDRTNVKTIRVRICPGLKTTNPLDGGIGYAERVHTTESTGKETLSPVWANEDIERIFKSNQESGRAVHVLPTMPKGKKFDSNSRIEAAMALAPKVRDNDGRILPDVGHPTGEMCNLQAREERNGLKRAASGGGPQSQDREAEGAIMLNVQLLVGSSRGEVSLDSCDAGVPHPPHVISSAQVAGAQWDWFKVGGRWNGFFKLKPQTKHLATLGRPGLQTMNSDYKPPERGRADVCRKEDIDIDGMRDEAGQKAADRYDRYTAITAGCPTPTTWQKMQDKHTTDGETDYKTARDEYQEQPAVAALRNSKDHDAIWWDVEDFQCSREEYIERARAGAIRTFSVVKDSLWFERGSMGWWGCVSDEKDIEEWTKQFSELFDSLPGDTLLTVADCHI